MADELSCAGCQARESEVQHLRAQNKELLDRLLAAANPQAFALATGRKDPIEAAVTHWTDDLGESYVMHRGVAVPLKELDRLAEKQGGYVDPEGRVVPKEQYDQAVQVLEDSLNGRATTIPAH